MKKNLMTLALLSAFALLTACGGKTDGNATASGQVESETIITASDTKNNAKMDKYNAYIQLSNQLMRIWSSDNTFFAENMAKNWDKVQKGDFKAVKSASSLEHNQKKLDEAIAKTANMGELDSAAKKLKTAFDAHAVNWKALAAYNEAKKYEDDNGEFGKKALPDFIKGELAVKAAFDEFQVQLAIVDKQMKEQLREQYKAEGRLLELYTQESMGDAEELLALFENEKDIKDAAKIDEGNKILAKLDENLMALDKQYQEEKDKEPRPSSSYASVHSDLIRLTASYREMRKGDVRKQNDMVRNYNSAVGSFNRIR